MFLCAILCHILQVYWYSIVEFIRMESSVSYSAHAENRMKPPSKLMQSLFELCVIVGMDEDTGLVPMSRVMFLMWCWGYIDMLINIGFLLIKYWISSLMRTLHTPWCGPYPPPPIWCIHKPKLILKHCVAVLSNWQVKSSDIRQSKVLK
jgi:hypothetical protein